VCKMLGLIVVEVAGDRFACNVAIRDVRSFPYVARFRSAGGVSYSKLHLRQNDPSAILKGLGVSCYLTWF
jgi:hypothetical protein